MMSEEHMMSTSLTLGTARRNDGKLVLTAAGEIDLSNIDVFDQALTTATSEAVDSGGTLTVDLRAVEYLDSSAINALFTRADHIDLIAHPVLIPILKISGLAELVTIHSGPAAADD
jgi:anti-anti-sigma factor